MLNNSCLSGHDNIAGILASCHKVVMKISSIRLLFVFVACLPVFVADTFVGMSN